MELVVLGDDERNQAMTSPRAHDLDEGVSGYFAIPEKSGTIDTDELNEMFEPTTTDDDAETGNFHLGSHHFSASGVKYFSSNCQACKDFVAAIHNGKNSEGSKFHSNTPLVRASSGNLSKAHSAIDVQCCSSATCEHCCAYCSGLGSANTCPIHPKAGSVAFIKTGSATFLCRDIGQKNNNDENVKDKRSSSIFRCFSSLSPKIFWSKSKQ